MTEQYPDARRYTTDRRQDRSGPERTHKAALVIIPPEDQCERIDEIRRKHDRKIGRWMPHINLIYPFRSRRQFGVAARSVAEACASVEPFEITLGEFGSFDHGTSHTMWLDPVPNEPMIQLQKALFDRFQDCDAVNSFETGFRPHLSVGQAKTQEDVDGLIAEFSRDWEPLVFTVDNVAMIWRSRQTRDVFKVDRRIKLGATQES